MDIQTAPSGSHKLRVSLDLGSKRKRMRISIGLDTHDFMEAQRRGIIILRLLKRLGVYDRDIPLEPENQGPELTGDMPLFWRDDNQNNNGNAS